LAASTNPILPGPPLATLAVGMWAVTVSGGVVSSWTLLVDPNCAASPCSSGAAPGDPSSGANFITTGLFATDSVPVPMSSFALQSGQHLYVQYWRHQTVAYAGGGNSNRLAQMTVNDGIASITLPTASIAPDVPALVSPADALRTSNATPQLQASYVEADANAGTLTFQLCSDPNCTSVVQSSTTSNLASGTNGAWTPTSLPDGKYYWRAQARDSVTTNVSNPSGTRSFVVDTTPPSLPTLGSPAAGARVNNTALSATFVDSDATDSGTVTFQVCTSNDGGISCSSVLSSSTSSVVGAGAVVSWTAPSPGPDGTYYWQARATDLAGNATGWTALRKFVLDTKPPDTPILVSPADGASLGAGAALTATFQNSDATDSGKVNFQVCSNNICTAVVASGTSTGGLLTGHNGSFALSGVGDGSYYWQAQSQDAAGNKSGWSAIQGFAYDGTPPTVTATAPASGLNTNHIPTLTATYSDVHPDSLTFEVCRTSDCASVAASTTFSSLAASVTESWTPGLLDGTYYWRVRGTDSFGNTSAWSAGSSFRFDGTPPQAPVLQNADGMRTRTAPVLSARIDDPGDTDDSARLLVEFCVDPGCAIVPSTGYSAAVAVGSVASAQAPPEVDGTYYWRALAEDAVGNQSVWSATRSFVVDTVAPGVPAAVAPAEGTAVNAVRVSGTFVSADPTDRGTVDFQICSDADFANAVASGSSASVAAGATATWTFDSLGLDDGTYYWRAYAEDEAGNDSAWSETWSFVLDQTPPGRPQDFNAQITGRVLTLSWRPPADLSNIRGYALIVNGKKTQTLKPDTLKVRIRLRKNDRRSFAVAAIDQAGNMSEATRTIATFKPPLSLKQARAAAVRRHR
jgi:hypothetical protein